MKKFFKEDLYIFLILIFVFLLFKNNFVFKKSILNGCLVFFENVFPSLFPMFLINDLLINYNFFHILDTCFSKLFFKIFRMPPIATYIFILSIFSGTPTNAYITTNLVKEKKLTSQDASIILSYSCFLNPLFLYTMLNTIFHDSSLAIKIIFINYATNFFLAFFLRNYNYQFKRSKEKITSLSFTKALSNSIERSFKTFINILGTIIFYFMLCECLTILIPNPLFSCIINGFLEATGGLAKLASLNSNYELKILLCSLFISFGGFSIHTQIKNIISDASISYRYFFLFRIFHMILSTCACLIFT